MRRIPAARLLRRLAFSVGGLLVVSLAAVLLAPALVRGARFGWVVEKLLPPMRGQVTLAGGRLDAGAVLALLAGRPFGVVLDGLRVVDPEGTVVLASKHLTARLEIHRAEGRIVIHDLRPGVSTWRLGRMQHHRGIGFVAAFASPGRRAARGVARAALQPQPFVFQIASADLDGLDAAFDFPSWGLDLGDVKAAGTLLVDVRDADHHVFGFEVQGIDARRGGALRILDGAQAARLPFQHAAIARVAITPERQNDLQLVVTAAETGQSRLSGQATFGGVVGIDPSAPPGLAVKATLAAPAEALAALGVGTRLGPVSAVGASGMIDLTIDGPYTRLTAALAARDLDLAYRRQPIGRAQLDASASLGPLQADIRRLELVAPGGGRIDVRGSLDRALDLTGAVRFRQVVTEAFLPPALRAAGAGVLSGTIEARGGLGTGSFALSRLDLTWERPPRAPRPRVIRLRSGTLPDAERARPGLTVKAPGLTFADGLLTMRRLALPALGGRLSIDGDIRFWRGRPAERLLSPEVSLDLRAEGIDVDQAGLAPLIGGRVTLAARARGTFDDLAARLTMTPGSRVQMVGASYAAAGPVALRAQHGQLVLSGLSLVQVGSGGKSRVDLRGRIVPGSGELDMWLNVADRDLAGLPALGASGLPLQGRLDARLRLHGRLSEPALSGEATLKEVAFRGRALGGGQLVLQADRRGRSRLHGVLFDRFTIDGAVADRPGEPFLDLTLAMKGAVLDPFVPALPPMLEAGRATATGQVSLQIGGDRPAAFAAHFTELALSYQLRPPPAARRPPTRVAIRSVGPVDGRMVGWGDQLTLDEAAFDFGAGGLRAAGTVRAGAVDARAHGPIDLGLLAPLFDAVLPNQIKRVVGQADADLRIGGTLSAPRVRGRLTVARPVEVALRQLPGAEVRLSSGALLFDDPDTIRLTEAAATFHYRDGPSFTDAQATLLLDARADGVGRPGGPSLSGRVSISSAQLTALALGDTLRVRDARVVAANGVITVPSLEMTSDHHGRFVVGGPGQPPATLAIASLDPFQLGDVDVAVRGADVAYGPLAGLKIDDMDLSLRLRGDLRRGAVLSGDVALLAGKFQVDAKPPVGAAPAPGRAPARPRGPTLRDRIALDVRLRSNGERFVVAHRFLPVVRVRLDLRAGGTLAAPKISGRAAGTDLYSWLALLLVRPFR